MKRALSCALNRPVNISCGYSGYSDSAHPNLDPSPPLATLCLSQSSTTSPKVTIFLSLPFTLIFDCSSTIRCLCLRTVFWMQASVLSTSLSPALVHTQQSPTGLCFPTLLNFSPSAITAARAVPLHWDHWWCSDSSSCHTSPFHSQVPTLLPCGTHHLS